MNFQFTAVLIVGAVASFSFMLRKIRKSEISIADSTFWFLFSLSLVLLAVFPQIAFFCADLLGMQAPSNFVFLYVIAVVVIRQFLMTAENARLRSRLTTLVQEQALAEAVMDERSCGDEVFSTDGEAGVFATDQDASSTDNAKGA